MWDVRDVERRSGRSRCWRTWRRSSEGRCDRLGCGGGSWWVVAILGSGVILLLGDGSVELFDLVVCKGLCIVSSVSGYDSA